MSDKFETIAAYVAGVLAEFLPAPIKGIVDPLNKDLKSWVQQGRIKRSLLEAAKNAENEFCLQAKEVFQNDHLVQAVVSLPIYNTNLFQSALRSLPDHLNEKIVSTHLSEDFLNNWKGEISLEEIKVGVALYMDCLRMELLKVDGLADAVERLAVLRTDRRTAQMGVKVEQTQATVERIEELLSRASDTPKTRRVPSTRQIPVPPSDFIGREDDIKNMLDDIGRQKGAFIAGMAGVGKTALGRVIAQMISENFSDAQIFIDMKGTSTPISSDDAMRQVILDIIPDADLSSISTDELIGLYRTILSDKHTILFFDNVHNAQQVSSLMPPLGSVIIITSRTQFSIPGLQSRRVDALNETDAINFLLDLCPRIEKYATILAGLVGYLPLALRIAGSFLQINNNVQVQVYVDRYKEKRLKVLEKSHEEIGSDEADVITAFELTYSSFTVSEQKQWDVLGIFPSSFLGNAAATLWELNPETAESQLSLFNRHSFLEYDQTLERYKLHDLLADFALSHMSFDEQEVARFRHAKHYSNALRFAANSYNEGGIKQLYGLWVLDIEWLNILAGQKWLVANINNKEAAMLYSKYTGDPYLLRTRLPARTLIDWVNQALIADRVIGDRNGESVDIRTLGNAYAQLGEIRKAIEYFEKSLKISLELNDREGEGVALSDIGNAYIISGDGRRAIQYHQRALEIDKELGNLRNVATDLSCLGTAYGVLSEIPKAIEYLKMALEVHQQNGFLDGEASVLDTLGGLISDNNPRAALSYLNRALEVNQLLGDKGGISTSLSNLGKVYSILGNYQLAVESYTQALAITIEIEDRHSEGLITSNLGKAYHNLGFLDKALEFHEAALKIDQEVGDLNGVGIDLGNLGIVYQDMGKFEEAINCYETRIELCREIGDLQGEGLALNNLGMIYKDLGNKEKARELFLQAIKNHETSGSAFAGEFGGKARRNLMELDD